MPEWIPVSGSVRGDLVRAALREFALRDYRDVAVGELARSAGVTTGALYHHFGSKIDLYRFVRADVDQRVLDRMAGAAEAVGDRDPATALRAALAVSFGWATAQGLARMLAEPPPGPDPVAGYLTELAGGDAIGAALAGIVVAGWRAALRATVDGVSVPTARRALDALTIDTDRLRDPA